MRLTIEGLVRKQAQYKYHATTDVGPLVLRKGPSGLWCFYRNGQRWDAVGEWKLPDSALDSLTMYSHPFPPHAGKIGSSYALGLSDKLSDWARVSVGKSRKPAAKP